jgi:tetratricopeptide (TPR) repeat protein
MPPRSDDHGHTTLTHLRALGRVAFTTLANYLVGLTPEENHWRKGEAWGRIGAYRSAIWHFRKFLTYSEDSHVRAHLAWCYAQLGMHESAVQQYRQAYVRNKHAKVALGLAHVETELGNLDAARAVVRDLQGRRLELGDDGRALLDRLSAHLTVNEAEPPPDALDP